MMTQISPEQLQAAFSAAPEKIVTYIEEGMLATTLGAIATRQGVSGEGRRTLIIATRDMLIGLANEADYKERLRASGIQDALISSLLQEVGEKILKPLGIMAPKPVAAATSAPVEKPAPMTQTPIQTPAAATVAKPSPPAPKPAPMVTPSPSAAPKQVEQPLPAPKPAASKPVTYGNDPYREPIE